MLYFVSEEKENALRLSPPARPYLKSKMKLNTEWSEVEILIRNQSIFRNTLLTNTSNLGTWTGRGFNFDYFRSKMLH
jgi:hypothetical protein